MVGQRLHPRVVDRFLGPPLEFEYLVPRPRLTLPRVAVYSTVYDGFMYVNSYAVLVVPEDRQGTWSRWRHGRDCQEEIGQGVLLLVS